MRNRLELSFTSSPLVVRTLFDFYDHVRTITHIQGIVGSSTLRLTLAAHLFDQLSLRPKLTNKKVVLLAADNARLTAWMPEHLRVVWVGHPSPWSIEPAVVAKMQPPLNIDHNRSHPYCRTNQALGRDSGMQRGRPAANGRARPDQAVGCRGGPARPCAHLQRLEPLGSSVQGAGLTSRVSCSTASTMTASPLRAPLGHCAFQRSPRSRTVPFG